MAPSGDRGSVDRAALLGTTLAAVVALTFGGRGAWEWLASVVGLALLALLVGFLRLPTDAHGSRRELLALSGVTALCATLVVSAPLQIVLSVATPIGPDCAASGAAAAAEVVAERPTLGPLVARRAEADAAGSATGECLGAATNRWLWVPAAGFAVLVFAGGSVVLARREPEAAD